MSCFSRREGSSKYLQTETIAVDVCCDAVDVCCDVVDAEDVCCGRVHFRLKDKYTTASKVSCLMEKDTKEKRTIILQDQKYCDASNIS